MRPCSSNTPGISEYQDAKRRTRMYSNRQDSCFAYAHNALCPGEFRTLPTFPFHSLHQNHTEALMAHLPIPNPAQVPGVHELQTRPETTGRARSSDLLTTSAAVHRRICPRPRSRPIPSDRRRPRLHTWGAAERTLRPREVDSKSDGGFVRLLRLGVRIPSSHLLAFTARAVLPDPRQGARTGGAN